MNAQDQITKEIEAYIQTAGKMKGHVSFMLQKPPSPQMGDLSFPIFDLASELQKDPTELARQLSKELSTILGNVCQEVKNCGPYINFLIHDHLLFSDIVEQMNRRKETFGESDFGKGKEVVLEYSSPNTNKPQHIGHLRNNFLGDSLARILKSQGFMVHKVGIINDRGVHICKSMLMYQKYGRNQTPESMSMKQDHFVGNFYEMFEKDAMENLSLVVEAQEMLQKWEQGDKEVRELWKRMNTWVYEGWKVTYDRLNVSFDKLYYESEVYEGGKNVVEDGVRMGIFYKRQDGAVEIDLSEFNLDHKVLLRPDGTSVYITQDLYLAKLRSEDFPNAHQYIYIVGKDQEYHFNVLFTILKKLGFDHDYFHLSYGMVRLPEGKMSSRKGTVVNADDLIDEVVELAYKEVQGRERGDAETFYRRANKIGLAALKYYLLRVDAQKDIVFDSNKAVRFEGDTGPYIMYTYARIASIFEKTSGLTRFEKNRSLSPKSVHLNSEERAILSVLGDFGDVLKKAALEYNPAYVAHYVFELAGTINSFYHKHHVLRAKEDQQDQRLLILQACGHVLKKGLELLGIDVVEKM